MSRGPGRWARALAPIVLACACNVRPLAPNADAGAIASGRSPEAGGAGAGGPASDGATGAGPAGDAGAATGGGPGSLCPPVDQPAGPSAPVATPAPTQVQPPFSCQPLASTYFFPPPGDDVPGRYSRCASFDVGAATAVAVSPDGSLVALATGDGLVRLVEAAEHRVWAVLASPRATIDYVAYAPDGSSILTLARAQREVTLWRAGDWTPVWRITLPGTPYYHLFGGGLAFSPDGSTAVVSPGSDTFLIHVGSGAILAWRAAFDAAVLDVAFGWGGRRIVVAEPSLATHCDHTPNGGIVRVFDAATLAPVATLTDLGNAGPPGGWHGIPQFRASPDDDLVLLPVTVDDPPGSPLHAFRLSDGGALPAPALGTLPAAFMSDGSVLVMDGGALLRVGIADGITSAVAMVGAAGPVALARNGLVLAIGGSGTDLLRVWRADGGGAVTAACSTAAPVLAPDMRQAASLSADGQVLALATGPGVKVFNRNGRMLANLQAPGWPYLSPSGALVAVRDPNHAVPAVVLRVADGAKLAEVPYDAWNWAKFVFSPREDRLYSNGDRDDSYRMDVVNLMTGSADIVDIPQDTLVIGTSNGCPLLYQGARGAWRSCGGCDDPAVEPGPSLYNPWETDAAVSSADGQYVAIRPEDGVDGVALWRLLAAPTMVAAIPQGPAVIGSARPPEYPVAVAVGGGRVLTGARDDGACSDGPQYEILVHDIATDKVIDLLPPAPAAVDATARTLAYGPQLWCAR
jgi:hypothetical protein